MIMRHIVTAAMLGLTLIASVAAAADTAAPAPRGPRITESFDHTWRFLKSDAPGAERPDFDDSAWRTLDVPHDWSIEGPFDQKNLSGAGGGYAPCGIGWYRKSFALPADYAGKKVFIDFDGVYKNSDVWINGQLVGNRPYGYSSFRYELTPHLHLGPGQANTLAVRVDNAGQPGSRWYSGSGIYRHVRLVVTDPVHVDHWGTYITNPEATPQHATVHVRTTVVNQRPGPCDITLQTILLSPDGTPAGTGQTTSSIAGGGRGTIEQDISLTDPKLWDLDHPQLYHAHSRVSVGGNVVDEDVTPFGIRTIRYDAATGFCLNGKNLKMKGVCLHHDGGGLGAAVPLGLWERRFKQLKEFGCNAIRTSHNPVAPEFLDLADRMGFLVMDECFDVWTKGKCPCDYHLNFKQWWERDLETMIRRDRNHPSIVIYSAGNEIPDIFDAALGRKIFIPIRDLFHQLDPTRPVTAACNAPSRSHINENGFADLMDVAGYNYAEDISLEGRKANPKRKIIGTENRKGPSPWLAVRDNPALCGQFLWTGYDYLGEAHAWPAISHPFGMFDRTGNAYASGFQQQSFWSTQPMVHVFRPRHIADDRKPKQGRWVGYADWNPAVRPGEKVEVEVYCNCQAVELLLNGRSLGTQKVSADASPLKWTVAYEPGVLKAVAKNGDQVVCTSQLQTAGAAAKLLLAADQPALTTDWNDISCLNVCIADAQGTRVPAADPLVTFAITGPGKIVAVDNGDLTSHESFQGNQRHAFEGRCVAIVQATDGGEITVTATAPGLPAATVTLNATR